MILLMFVFYFICEGACQDKILVKVEQGILQGRKLVPSIRGKSIYYSFKGIPYAKPPLEELRFQSPQPPLKWNSTRDASEHGSICTQQKSVLSNVVVGSEDCLYLNVYTPNLNPCKPMAVMFFIHGGFFVTGSGNDDFYSPDFLVGYNIVLVTINYRLSALGFLSVDTLDAPGNAGLKDQVAAMKWVKRNIRNFGGDPNNVTIFGQSVGGSSVTLHTVSPATKGLFKRAISMSGTMFNHFSISFAHVERAFNLGRRLGFNTDDPKQLINYLRTIPAEKLVEVRPDIQFSDPVTNSVLSSIYYGPIVEKELGEGQYLTEQPRDLVCKGIYNDVDYMIGYTENEAIYPVFLTQDSVLKNYPMYKQLFVPEKILNIRSSFETLKLGEKIKKYYFGNGTVTLSTINSFLQYYSYSHYYFDIHYFLDNVVPKCSNKRRFLYVFGIYSTRNAFSKQAAERFGTTQATHLDDLPYLFDGERFNVTLDLNSEAYKYVKKMCTLYTNFAKYGTPTPNKSFGIIWPDYRTNMEYVRIDKILTKGKVEYSGQLGFWKNIYRKSGVVPYLGQI